MIPTREQIEEWESNEVGAGSWLLAMRDEIDRLTAANEAGGTALLNEQREAAKVRAELKAADDDAIEDSDRADRNAELVAKLRAELDAAHTDAALARDANNGEVQLLKSQLQLAIERIERVSVKADSAEHWERQAALARGARNAMEAELTALRSDVDAAKLILPVCCGSLADAADTLRQERDALAKANDGIAWCKEEFEFIRRKFASIGRTFDIDDPRGDISVLMADFASMQHVNASLKADAVRLQSELDMTNAQLAKARDALDKATTATGRDAKLRELRAWIIDEKGFAPGIVRKIDELLAAPAKAAEPAPCKECDGTKTITKVDWPGETSNMYQEPCPQCAKPAEPAPADDTRWELVAQLADAMVTMCGGQGFGAKMSEVRAIAAQLRGGKG